MKGGAIRSFFSDALFLMYGNFKAEKWDFFFVKPLKSHSKT